ncbi:MAG: flagellar hook-basal body complex protein FliE [Ilumatobacteraceae bacterium]|jgi:flagellar hook-basal body complex protein FliE
MALSIPPISATRALAPMTRTDTVGAPAASGSGNGIVGQFGNMLDQLAASQNKADSLAVQAATGDLSSIQALTMASTEAQLMTQLTVTIRNRALEAFRDIMGMQV